MASCRQRSRGFTLLELLVVVVIIGLHGWLRAQVRKFRNGQVRPVSPVLMWVVLAAAAAIILLGAHHGLLRKGG